MYVVMAGLVPTIRVFAASPKDVMPGTKPGTTSIKHAPLLVDSIGFRHSARTIAGQSSLPKKAFLMAHRQRDWNASVPPLPRL
jgi:hypothetical protein